MLKKGFTLIELMVSISIIGILSSIGVAKYSNFNRTEMVRQAALDLENNLILVRNKAMVGEKNPDTCLGSEPLSGWSVTFNPDTNCWGRNGKCDSECGASSVASQDVYTSCAKGGVCSGNCWSSNGIACDSECRYANATLSTVYPNCNSSVCAVKNCWGVDNKCDSGCNVASVNSATVYSSCTPESCNSQWQYAGVKCTQTLKCSKYVGSLYSLPNCTGSVVGYWTEYVFHPCSSDGSGDCYCDGPYSTLSWESYSKPSTSSCSNYSCNRCQQNATSYNTCSWHSDTKWSVSNSTTKYSGSGTCKSGSGTCYKPENGKTYFTGGADCGASGCPSGFYYDRRICSWYSTLYSYSVSGSSIQAYQGGGSCNAGGTGSCYKLTNGGTYYTGNAPCGSYNCAGANNYFRSSQPCSFLGSIYQYTASDKVAKLKGSGSCSSDGSGDCYKMLNSSSYYTGDGKCGDKCLSDNFYDSSLKCDFYGEAGGANAVYQIRGVCGENVFNFKNFNLPRGVTISHSPEEMVFKPIPAFGVDQPGDICVSGFGKYYKITITDTGEIRRVGFVETCP